jgi:hypothetical protein
MGLLFVVSVTFGVILLLIGIIVFVFANAISLQQLGKLTTRAV